MKETGTGTLTSWLSWMFGDGGDNNDNIETEELRKTVQHLNNSNTSLGQIFSVTPGQKKSFNSNFLNKIIMK